MILGYASMLDDGKNNEMEKFDKNKRYIYDLESVLKDAWKKELYETGYSTKFINEANGKEVEVIDKYNAIVTIFNKNYKVGRSNCKEM
jgi:hypothetical protein